MARLIDANNISNMTEYIKTDEELKPYIYLDDLVKVIDSQTTAYDIDKVVEELEHIMVYEVLDGLLAGEWIKKEQVLRIVKEGGIK